MRVAAVLLAVALVLAVRLAVRARRRRSSAAASPVPDGVALTAPRRWARWSSGDVGLVAGREIRERVRGRIFKVGTLFILLGVGAAIVVPKIHHASAPLPQKVGVVGMTSPSLDQVIEGSARQSRTTVRIVPEQTLAGATKALRHGTIELVVIDGASILVDQPIGSNASSDTAALVQSLAPALGIMRAYQEAGLSPTQMEQLAAARPVPVHDLQPSPKKTGSTTSVIGIVLLFLMLTQYNTWILMGVMQEKSSRVVEVLLAALRPIQLLGGKVLGIGLVAMGQAALIVGVALALAGVVGSDLLKGSAPLVLLAELLWLVLGYAFYCWVYAAAGSLAERQDQVQTLVLPLSLPIILAYVFSITVASTGNPSVFFKILAYLPPTAPFAMPVLVGLNQVAWWQFVASAVLSLVATVFTAWAAAGIYRRAVLRSGQRVRLRDLTFGRGAPHGLDATP